MQTIRLITKADADGILRLNVPLTIDVEYEVTIQPKVDELGWPLGYFEATYGSIQDEAFKRYPQGEYEKRESFE